MLHTYCVNFSPIPFHRRLGETVQRWWPGDSQKKHPPWHLVWGANAGEVLEKLEPKSSNKSGFHLRKRTAGTQILVKIVDVSPFPRVYVQVPLLQLYQFFENLWAAKLLPISWKTKGTPQSQRPPQRNKALLRDCEPPASRNNPSWEWPCTFLRILKVLCRMDKYFMNQLSSSFLVLKAQVLHTQNQPTNTGFNTHWPLIVHILRNVHILHHLPINKKIWRLHNLGWFNIFDTNVGHTDLSLMNIDTYLKYPVWTSD